jgi:hypothetical protein
MPRGYFEKSKNSGKTKGYRYIVKDKYGVRTLERRSFESMPKMFKAAETGWQLTATPNDVVVVPHNPTNRENWTYTLTYEYAVPTIRDGEQIVRGHVHYVPDDGKLKAVPGRFWVSGVEHHDAETPEAIVGKFADWEVESGAANLGRIDPTVFE